MPAFALTIRYDEVIVDVVHSRDGAWHAVADVCDVRKAVPACIELFAAFGEVKAP